MTVTLTDRQYHTLLNLYSGLLECFKAIPQEYQDAFFARLHAR